MFPHGWSSISTDRDRRSVGSVDLYWLPLGAGGRCVRLNGVLYESVAGRLAHREPQALYHSALEARLDDDRFVVEMAPAWNTPAKDRGVVAEGPVGLSCLGRSRFFRYEVRRWLGGRIPDVAEAVQSPRRMSSDPSIARHLLALVPDFPTYTWGADEQRTGDMWNSNSLVSWLLAMSGHDLAVVGPPPGGRAPGWSAGLVVARRDRPDQEGPTTLARRRRVADGGREDQTVESG
jgi:hypothetical protein